MRKTMAAVAGAVSLLAVIAAASPALAKSRPITLLCSSSTNGGTLVNGVCVLPAAAVSQPYEAFLLTSNGAVDTFTITKGGLPPGLSMPATYGAAGTIVGGTPTSQGAFTFTVHVTKFGASTPSTNGTYSITVGSPSPLTITFPSTCCNAGTVGSSYLQNFFTSGGISPFTWTVAGGQLPPGVVLTGSHLGGTPTVAGTFTFTIKVTDSAGNQATEPGSITVSP
jgi:Putative Ig domain